MTISIDQLSPEHRRIAEEARERIAACIASQAAKQIVVEPLYTRLDQATEVPPLER